MLLGGSQRGRIDERQVLVGMWEGFLLDPSHPHRQVLLYFKHMIYLYFIEIGYSDEYQSSPLLELF
jgi:hypothetical protein